MVGEVDKTLRQNLVVLNALELTALYNQLYWWNILAFDYFPFCLTYRLLPVCTPSFLFLFHCFTYFFQTPPLRGGAVIYYIYTIHTYVLFRKFIFHLHINILWWIFQTKVSLMRHILHITMFISIVFFSF